MTMEKLGNIASILRSKNAGPLTMTFDVIFAAKKDYERIKNSGVLTADLIAKTYGAKPEHVEIIYYDIVNALKITIPRRHISGALEDGDIYGCQQQMPLYNIAIP
jgi:hypothetical protein